jgi:hypothetical protein
MSPLISHATVVRAGIRHLLRGTMLVALVSTIGCVSSVRKQPVELERFAVTALQGDPHLAVMVTRNDVCTLDAATRAETCVAQAVTARQDEWFVRCLAGGFYHSNFHPDIRALDAGGELRGELSARHERVSHLVAFAFKLVRDVRSDGQFGGAGSGGGGILWGGKLRCLHVDFSASVIDVPKASLVGRLTTTAEGGRGAGASFLLPVPIPIVFPMFDNADAKGDSCETLGQAVARFLYSTSTPATPRDPP